MSHHLDSPLAQKDPRLDISDVYVFKGKSGTVLVMNVNPQSGKGGFHHEAMYELRVDKNNDAVEDLTLRLVFGERNNDRQTVTVSRLGGEDAASREAEGTVVAQGSTDEVFGGEDGLQVFTGSAGEPFFMEGRVITAVKTAVTEGAKLALDDFDPSTAQNLFGNTNVSTIVLEVPNDWLGDEIGFWGTVALATDAGGWRQVQRCATPLVNTLFDVTQLHIGDGHGDYNATNPADDMKNYGAFVREKVAAVVKANNSADDPEGYAKEFVEKLFPDMLRYKVGSEAAFTTSQRNGRDLKVNVTDVLFELVMGKPVPLHLDTTDATGELRDTFPYLSQPVKA